MCTYYFSVKYYDDYQKRDIWEKGTVCADSYKNAIDELTDYFGEGEIENIEIHFLHDSAITLFPLGAYQFVEDFKEKNTLV